MDNIQELIQNRVRKALEAMPFEVKIPLEWYFYAVIALGSASTMGIGLYASELRELYKKLLDRVALNAFEFSIVNNMLQEAPPKVLGLEDKLFNFYNLQEKVEELAKEWNKYTKETRDKVMAEVITGAKKAGFKMSTNDEQMAELIGKPKAKA